MLRTRTNHDEEQYLELIRDIISEGHFVEGRNGTTKSVIGAAMRFNLTDGTMPILTTKKVAHKTCLKELLWFISGSTNNARLQEQGVKIWNGNASREYLDSIGLKEAQRAENDLGPIYGHQWRHFNAPYMSCHEDYAFKGVDQLGAIIEALKDPVQRFSRRLVMSAWNPCQLPLMALPPCHVLAQFHVQPPNKLMCSMYQRSGDVGLGVPFNIASYAFLTHLIAHHCDLEAHSFCYHLGDCHIYDDHLNELGEQVTREPLPFPTLRIDAKRERIEDYIVEDFVVEGYTCHPPIKMEMRA